jgi:hypothetical protein
MLNGSVDRTVTADTPLYAVFRKGAARTYAAYNARGTAKKVQFSDGATLTAEPGKFAVMSRPVAP